MRSFEIIILACMTINILSVVLLRKKNGTKLFSLALVNFFIMSLHIVVEGQRWQMYPAYLMVSFLLCYSIYQSNKRQYYIARRKTLGQKRWFKITTATIGLIWFAMSWHLPAFIPVFQLPNPSGPHQVGVASFQFNDLTRKEQRFNFPTVAKQIQVKVWYPAAAMPIKQKAEVYLSRAPMWLNHLPYSKTHAVRNALLPERISGLPVVLFSHGYLGILEENTILFEELASYGYVVVSLGHSYESYAITLPNGELSVEHAPVVNQVQNALDYFSYQEFKEQKTAKEKEKFLQAYWNEHKELQLSMEDWVLDYRFVLDQLELLQSGQKSSLFTQKLDLKRVAIIGRGFGGSAGVVACERDERCKASVSLDGFLWGMNESPQKSLLTMHTAQTKSLFEYFQQTKAQDSYRFLIPKAEHMDFTDFKYAVSGFRFQGVAGEISFDEVKASVHVNLLEFLQQSLDGVQSDLLRSAQIRQTSQAAASIQPKAATQDAPLYSPLNQQ